MRITYWHMWKIFDFLFVSSGIILFYLLLSNWRLKLSGRLILCLCRFVRKFLFYFIYLLWGVIIIIIIIQSYHFEEKKIKCARLNLWKRTSTKEKSWMFQQTFFENLLIFLSCARLNLWKRTSSNKEEGWMLYQTCLEWLSYIYLNPFCVDEDSLTMQPFYTK